MKKQNEIKCPEEFSIDMYIGLPRSGKSTIAAAEAYKAIKQGIKVYSNVPIKGTYSFKIEMLGIYDFRNALIIIDEAGIDMCNRKTLSLPMHVIKFFKLFGHYKLKILCFSQANDSDIVLRRCSSRMFLVKRGLLPWVTTALPVTVKIGPNKDGSDICQQYTIPDSALARILARKKYWMPRYWKMFDSFEAPVLNELPETVAPYVFSEADACTDRPKDDQGIVNGAVSSTKKRKNKIGSRLLKYMRSGVPDQEQTH